MFKGKHDRATAIFQRYSSSMHRLAYGIVKDSSDADDVVQKAMIKIIKNIDMIDDISTKKSANYIYVIVKNTAIDEFRQKKAELKKRVAGDVGQLANVIGENEIDYGFSEEMQEYLRELSEIDKDIICLKYGNDFTDKEISELLGIKAATVRQRLSRARKRLLAVMKRREEENEK